MLPTFEKASDNIKYLDSVINKNPVIPPTWESIDEERLIRHRATESWVWEQRTNGVLGTTNRKRHRTQSTTSSESNNSTITIDEASELTPPRNDEKSKNEAIELASPSRDGKSDISSLLKSSSCGSLIDSPEPEPLDFERNHDNELESNDSIEVQIININPAPQNEDIQAVYHEIILHDSDTEEISDSNTEEKENLSVLSFQSVLSF